ncbi:C-type mannose receptor 2-like [Centroberyx gerrardi]
MFLGITAKPTPHQYHFINQPLSWPEAQSYCRLKHADLATVDNMDDMNQLAEALGGDIKPSWIGLERRGPWRWLWSDGSGSAHFTNWKAGEPNDADSSEGCGEISEEGTWNDNVCGDAKSFVCYERRSDGMVRYVFYSGKWNWVKGQDICRRKHTDLARVRNGHENAAINNLVGSNKAWIGLFKDSWTWSDGSGTSFRYWLTGSPDNYFGNEKCAVVAMSLHGRWDDAPCDHKAPFVCQGGLKARKMVVRMKMSAGVDLTDSTISATLLQKLETSLGYHSMSDFKLSWRSDKDGQIFRRQEQREAEGAAGRPGC